MSQSQKRTGARDISELKARLGLNKKGSAGAQSEGGGPQPPGAQRSIPAPPGAQPPQPDPTSDPFGAMNAVASRGQQQQAASPEYIVVNDGQPVESVERSARFVTIGKIAAIAAVPLVLGVVVGQISSSAKVYNRSIEDAAAIRDDVRTIGRGLVSVQNALLVGKDRGPEGSFLPHDEELVEELDQLDTVKPNPDVAYRSYLYELEPQLVKEVFSFYNETQLFYEDLETHIERSRNDAKLLEKSESELGDVTPFSYGAYVEIPDQEEASGPEALPRVEVVELGQPVCEDGRPRPACQGAPQGFQYRPDPSGPWGQMDLGMPQGEKVGEENLFLMEQNALFDSFVAGAEETLAANAYLQRLSELEETLNDLTERRSLIEDQLTAWANESNRFTFFL